MTDSQDYRKFIESRIENLHENIKEHFEFQNTTLKRIEEQTLKTNGKVLKLEEKVEVLKDADTRHTLNCPRIPEVKKLEENIKQLDDTLLELKLIRKNPKMFIAILSVCIIMFIGSVSYSIYEIHSLMSDVKADIKSKTEIKK